MIPRMWLIVAILAVLLAVPVTLIAGVLVLFRIADSAPDDGSRDEWYRGF